MRPATDHSSPPPRHRRARGARPWALLVACAVLGALALVACGDSSTSSSGGDGDGQNVLRPEDVKAPLDEVKAKLPGIVQLGAQAKDAAAAANWDKAKDSFDNLMSIWFEVEGTVGDLDRNAYEAIETAQGLISDGIDTHNAGRVATGATNQQSAIQGFLVAHQ